MGKKLLKRLKFNLVSYDGFPEQFIEPVPNHNGSYSKGTSLQKYNAVDDGFGHLGGMQIVEGAAWPQASAKWRFD
jgi:hypothetical protein